MISRKGGGGHAAVYGTPGGGQRPAGSFYAAHCAGDRRGSGGAEHPRSVRQHLRRGRDCARLCLADGHLRPIGDRLRRRGRRRAKAGRCPRCGQHRRERQACHDPRLLWRRVWPRPALCGPARGSDRAGGHRPAHRAGLPHLYAGLSARLPVSGRAG